jgi:predicted DNA-binding protein (MmcQ/YjbR family)
MDLESVRHYCKSLPHVTEDVKWGHVLTFLIGNKMFCVLSLEPERGEGCGISFKCAPEEFADLVENEQIIPAPYMARNHWVRLVDDDALPPRELKERIAKSYRLVLATLPKKAQSALASAPRKRARK